MPLTRRAFLTTLPLAGSVLSGGVLTNPAQSPSLSQPAPTPAPAPPSTAARKPAIPPGLKPEDWVFLENSTLRLGVKRSSGAGIAWLSPAGSDENRLDHFDHGRLIQQSYYGKPDGSLWAGKPWRWNPVQGGDYQGHAAEVLSLTHDATTLKSAVRPRNWAGGELLTDCLMEQEIRLEQDCVIVRFRFKYSGTDTHPVIHHEVPAIFLNPALTDFYHYEGDAPWTDAPLKKTQPGWPNEGREIPESWAAYTNPEGLGVGVFVPVAKSLTCYRYGASPQAHGACSYFAPLVKFAITPGLDFAYEAALALGRPEAMRATFSRLRQTLAAPALPGNP